MLLTNQINECQQCQEELAMQLGVTAQAVSRWEAGAGMPDISLIVPIAQNLGVTTDTLFGMEDVVYDRLAIENVKKQIDTIKMDEKLEAANTKPAICFFEKNGQENSEQMKQYKELIKAGNIDLQYIMEYIKVFCFKVKESSSSNIVEYEIFEMDKHDDN